MKEIGRCYEIFFGGFSSEDNSYRFESDDYNFITYDEIEIECDIINGVKKEIPDFVYLDFSEVYYILFNKIKDKESRKIKIRYIDALKLAYNCQIYVRFSEIVSIKSSKLKEYFENGTIFYLDGKPCRYNSKTKHFEQYYITDDKVMIDEFK